MNKEQAKERIKRLIGKYESLSVEQRKGYNEQQTKDHFIRPLFEALGWDFENDVWPETDVSGKRVDYAFKLDGLTRLYVEAKPLSINLDEEKWAEQAINYSYHQSVPWVILTDFEGIKVFNTEWDEPNIQSCQFIELRYTEFLENEKLWWLSKEGFIKGLLDKKAEEFGRKPKKIPVDEQLAQDLVRWRDYLCHKLEAYNSGLVDKIKIAEYVQTILNRFIFIRTLEDKGYEDHLLDPLVKNWDKSKQQKIVLALNKIFRKIGKDYDSGLFDEISWDKLGEKLEYDDEIFIDVIKELYYNSNKIRYKFDQIPSDIFGSIYEQYLGHIQQEEKEKKSSKRKAQGIYYTPRYIVNYIVQNTLGEALKEKSAEEIRNLKILDPACGSGSFLINAFQTLLDYWQKVESKKIAKAEKTERLLKLRKGNLISSQDKMRILTNNIFGVDLDEEAVELAKLNLLLKIVGRRKKLPNIDRNIQNGNSLISGNEKELKEYFGKNWRDKKPFNWQEKFPFCHSRESGNPGFDIVIGNPPYLKEMDNKDIFEPIKNTEYKKYYQGKMDFWYFFLHRAIDVVKDGGFIGFITNSYFLKSAGASKLIERIKNELVLIKAVDLGDIKVFGDVSGRHIIHIYQKRQARKTDKTTLISVSKDNFNNSIDEKNKKLISSQKLIMDNKINFETTAIESNFKNCVSLGELYDVSVGVQESTDKVSNKQAFNSRDFKAGDGVFVLNRSELKGLNLTDQENKIIKKYFNTNDVGKYGIKLSNEFLIYSDKEAKQKIADGLYPNIKVHLDKMKKFITSSNKPYGLHRPRESKYFESPKLICKGMFLSPEFYYDEKGYYVGFSFSVIIQKDKNYSLKYLLGLLNSEFAKKWFNANGKKRGVGVDIGVLVFRKFPVYSADKKKQFEIAKLVDKNLELNRELQKLGPIMDDKEYNEVKEEIEKTDKEIDEKVYELYGLSEGEIKIVENPNK